MFRLLTGIFLQPMRLTDYKAQFISQRSAVISAFQFSSHRETNDNTLYYYRYCTRLHESGKAINLCLYIISVFFIPLL